MSCLLLQRSLTLRLRDSRLWIALALVFCSLSYGLRAAEMPPQRNATAEDLAVVTEIEEVEVVGKRLWQLRRDIIALQDQFYENFNALNKDDNFDIHCSNYAPTGTQIKRRVCLPGFVVAAQRNDARAFLEGRGTQSSLSTVAALYTEAYRETVRAALLQHPELWKLAAQQQQLEEQYKRAHAARLKNGWFTSKQAARDQK